MFLGIYGWSKLAKELPAPADINDLLLDTHVVQKRLRPTEDIIAKRTVIARKQSTNDAVEAEQAKSLRASVYQPKDVRVVKRIVKPRPRPPPPPPRERKHRTMDERKAATRVKNFQRFVEDNASKSGLLIEAQPRSIIDLIGDELEGRGDDFVFLDYTSLFGYLSSMLVYRLDKGMFYSRCDMYMCRDANLFIASDSHQHTLQVDGPNNVMKSTASRDHQLFITSMLMGRTDDALTHIFFHTNINHSEDDLLIMLNYFALNPTLEVVWMFSKPGLISDIAATFKGRLIKSTQHKGANGGVFNLYRFDRAGYMSSGVEIPRTQSGKHLIRMDHGTSACDDDDDDESDESEPGLLSDSDNDDD